jgi:hypothetical protein
MSCGCKAKGDLSKKLGCEDVKDQIKDKLAAGATQEEVAPLMRKMTLCKLINKDKK